MKKGTIVTIVVFLVLIVLFLLGLAGNPPQEGPPHEEMSLNTSSRIAGPRS